MKNNHCERIPLKKNLGGGGMGGEGGQGGHNFSEIACVFCCCFFLFIAYNAL